MQGLPGVKGEKGAKGDKASINNRCSTKRV